MSILVIGGMGFIGSRITKFLIDLGKDLIVMGRHRTLHRLTDVVDKVKVVQADKANIDQIIELIKVHHVNKIIDVSYTLEAESEQAPYHATKLNIVGTLNIFEAARIMGIRRIVWASSLAIYGDKKRAQGIPQNEDALNDAITVYGACKNYIEFMAKLYNARWDMDIVCLRAGTVYGPLRASGATGWVTDIVKMPLSGQAVSIPPGPEETMNCLFVDDCADAFVMCCQYRGDRLPHAIYNIGGVTILARDFVREVKKQIPGADIRYQGKYMYYLDRVDKSRLCQDTGFRLKYDVEAGIREQVVRQRALNEEEKKASN
ncbi:MAG: SDR family oxidoreductase [Thermodesulfobacteriota bacterium]|jgi:nucleoside-diphosphate-sugar epimerase